MASFASPRSQLLGVLLVTVITFTAVVDSARVSSAPTASKPVKVYPSCSKTLMPKRCSVKLSALSKSLAETKAVIAGPQLAAGKFKSDPCISGCAKVLDATTSKAAAAAAEAGGGDAIFQLKEYLYPLVISNEGPIGPCECDCPEPCSADEAAAVKKLGEATNAMLAMADLLQTMSDDDDQLTDEEKKAKVEPMEKSMDSGILHVSCGLTKEPQKCADELSALAKTMKEARHVAWELTSSDPATKLSSPIADCDTAMRELGGKLDSAEATALNLADIRGAIHSYVQGDGKQPPRCKCSCPPPPEKPCSANETAVVDSLNGVYDAWVAVEKFLTELLPPN
ncbi:hypothetical protein SETIT_7G307100v2 [Setaria italica]|uniref:Pectinesterase inhibitor domain-containing protein n=1 Tax=Setaria italica TaxID=4555 RepID=A0A368S1N3_SETIT|nr:hypothetical protein SETIT_7G307100v2 [Setaria italica]